MNENEKKLVELIDKYNNLNKIGKEKFSNIKIDAYTIKDYIKADELEKEMDQFIRDKEKLEKSINNLKIEILFDLINKLNKTTENIGRIVLNSDKKNGNLIKVVQNLSTRIEILEKGK